MYMNSSDEIEEERFEIEDIVVPYSSIEINHVNDNKPPLRFVLKRAIVWILIAVMVAGLFLL